MRTRACVEKWLFVSLMSTFGMIGAVWHVYAQQNGNPPAPVMVAEATQRVLAPVTWFPGTVISRSDSRLAAEVPGRVVWVADVGSVVQAGDVVVRLDDSLMQQTLAEYEAVIAREQARIKFYEQEVKRLQGLVKDNNVAQSQLDQAISNRGVTLGELAAARARHAHAKERLERTVIYAPFSGVITERLAQVGEWAESGEAVVRLVDSQALEVQAWVPVNALQYIHEQSDLRLQANPHTSTGKVRAIVPIGDDRSRLYELRLTPAERGWPVGQTLRVAVPSDAPREVLAVPRDALVIRRDGTVVYRVLEGNTAERVGVTTGLAVGPWIEVSGINAGDKVVVRGGERLRPGQNVVIVEGVNP